MSSYYYRARNRRGKVTKGKIKASSEEQASALLQQHGLFPLDITDEKNTPFWKKEFSLSRIKTRDRAIMSRQLGTMVEAGIPILQAVEILSVQTENPKLAEVLREVAYDIKGGTALSDSLEKFPDDFSEFFISMIRSGEQSGRISVSLVQLAEYSERDDELIHKVRGAFIYPAFVITGMIVMGIVMMTFVIPQLVVLFKDADVTLPLTTRVLIGTSEFFTSYWWFIILFLGFSAWLFSTYMRTPDGRYATHALLLRIPAVGNLLTKLYLARFSAALKTLVEGNVPVVQALLISRDTLGNRVYRAIIEDAAESVKNGSTIASAFEKYHQIPIMVYQMINVGERSGDLKGSLGSIERFYQREVNDILDNLTQLIEPIVIAVLGVGVAFLLIAVLVPIYQLVQVF